MTERLLSCAVILLLVLVLSGCSTTESTTFAPAIDSSAMGAPPQDHELSDSLIARLLDSTVYVKGQDCKVTQNGSGFVVAGGLVATGAHVVAGIEAPILVFSDDRPSANVGREVSSTVVAFDPVADLALLRPHGDFQLPAPLAMSEAAEGTVGVLLIHDGTRPSAIPALISQRIRATGVDIYGEAANGRDALVLVAPVELGYSGGAVVNAAGEVVGVTFSRNRGGRPVAYAVQSSELTKLIDGVDEEPVAAGPCRDGS
ncbi:MAG TPA: hypothetical protein DCR10_04880 [Acidimicrobiaceae bacterium]|nr:hypothetical protein [Acidimicrobiaceae bacterium]